MRHIKSYILIILLLSGMAGFHSCISDDIVIPPSENDSGKYLRLLLDISDLDTPKQDKNTTRAMNADAEKAIRPDLLNILVFKEGKFYYNAPIEGSIVYDENDHSKVSITVKIVKSENASEKFKIYVIANHDLSGFSFDQNTTIASVSEALTYSLTGEWKANSNDYTPFPMWGETSEITISPETTLPPIDLHRALARVDIGLNFTSNNGHLTEVGSGLADFSMKEIYVYRTYNGGHVIPSSGLNTPSIPNEATRRNDNDPLVYTIPETDGANQYVREIYIPEAELPSNPSEENMHCIVVGGYYKGSSTITYYRLDFADETTMLDRTFRPILRNNRYIFNITHVQGPGFSTPKDALSSTSSIRNLGYDLITWNREIDEIDVKGKYYFGITRHIIMPPQKHYSHQVYYQSNFPAIVVEKDVTFEWGKGENSPFGVAINQLEANMLMIFNKEDNVTNQILSDTLHITSGPFNIPVLVEQQFVNFTYTLDCETVETFGTYVSGESLNPTEHFIRVFLSIENVAALDGQTIILETEDLEGDHGIVFRGEESFNFGAAPPTSSIYTAPIILRGSGTLKAGTENRPFKLRIKSNSSAHSYCEATIAPVDRAMNILQMVAINSYGYEISNINGGTGKVFNNTNNFGSQDNSIVKVGEINYIKSDVNNFWASTSSTTYKWVTGIGNEGKVADLIYIAYGGLFDSNSAELLMQYLDKGGIIVSFIEDAATAKYLVDKLFSISNISTQAVATASLYPLPGHPLLIPDETQRLEVFRQYENDPILNGPFGDIRGQQIGEDVGSASALLNIPNHSELTVYAHNNNVNSPTVLNSTAVVGFKFEPSDADDVQRHLFYWCDGGMTSSGVNGRPNLTGYTLNPFNWDESNGFPIPMPSYGSIAAYRKPVYNSTLFGNVMAWAIKKSQELKEKRESFIENN